MIREPAVAGQFYPGTKEKLTEYLDTAIDIFCDKVEVMAVMAPHAGYFYSGGVAGKVFSEVVIPETVLLLGPNHTGMGNRAAVSSRGSWSTPLGVVDIEENLAREIIDSSPLFTPDEAAHYREHSLEVMLPFLQIVRPEVKIVPIALSLRSVEEIGAAGKAIAQVLKNREKELLIVVSSDMTHYESSERARNKDFMAIEKLKNLDPEGLLDTVASNSISMCGIIPASVMLFAIRELGAGEGVLIDYKNSGDASGDYDRVVGYASMYFR